MTIAKYNTTFTDKPQFEMDYCPTEEKQISHYVEGLAYEYHTTVRSKRTLIEDMDEALKVECDLTK